MPCHAIHFVQCYAASSLEIYFILFYFVCLFILLVLFYDYMTWSIVCESAYKALVYILNYYAKCEYRLALAISHLLCLWCSPLLSPRLFDFVSSSHCVCVNQRLLGAALGHKHTLTFMQGTNSVIHSLTRSQVRHLSVCVRM